MKKLVWPVRVLGKCCRPDGTIARMDRTVEGAGGAEAAMLGAVLARKDRGRPFVGDTILGITPLGQRIILLLEPDSKEK